MLDVLQPLPAKNIGLVKQSVERICECTDVPVRIVSVLDGGDTEQLNELHSVFHSLDVQWVLLHNESPHHLGGALKDAVTVAEAPLIAIIPPEVMLDDERWFGKMQRVVSVDPLCGIIDADPNTKSTSLAPVKRPRHRYPESSKLALLTKRFAPNIAKIRDVDENPIRTLSSIAMDVGLTSWSAPGVRYHVATHEEHKKWRERSATTEGSLESSSPTTPD